MSLFEIYPPIEEHLREYRRKGKTSQKGRSEPKISCTTRNIPLAVF